MKMLPLPECLSFLLFLVVHPSHQLEESCNKRVYPDRVDIVNSSSILGILCEEGQHGFHNCTLTDSALTDGSTDQPVEGRLVWENPGSLTFHFVAVPIGRVTIQYYADSGSSSGLPSITITSFPVIGSRSDHPGPATYNASTTRRMPESIDQLKMTFDPLRTHFKAFHLSKVEFYTCEYATTSVSTNQGQNRTTLVITVSATVLGTLLLLVLVTLTGLICVVLWKRRPTEIYRVNRPLRRNTYEVGANWESPKGGRASIAKHLQELEPLASASSVPPTDPEYATISEWRKISGLPQPQPDGVGVSNPFYASSSVSIPNKCNVLEPPACMGTSFVYGRNLEHSCAARSLQDMRSTGLREGASTQGQVGSMGRRTHTLATSGSSRNIPSRTVRRNESMREDISTGYRPTPPPRPVLLKRGTSLRSVGGAEPYLLALKQVGRQPSPLTCTHTMKAGKEAASNESSIEEDVGNDNYIIVPK